MLARIFALGALLLVTTPVFADDRPLRLESGEIIVESFTKKGVKTPKVRATGLLPAPPEKVWPLIDKCANYKTTMLRIKESAELSRNGNVVKCRVVISMPWPLSDLKNTTLAKHTIVPGKLYQRQWKLIEGDFTMNNGRWTLTPYGDGKRTLAVYEVQAEPKSGVPDAIRKAAQKKTLPELFEHIRKQVK